MKSLKKLCNIVKIVLMAVVVIAAILLAGIRLIGMQVFTVLSGSMEPNYHTGSLIYVKTADYRDLKEGDVITFMLDTDTVATHRIVGLVPDEKDPDVIRYRTKGDANEAEDGKLVHYKNILGTPVFTIPKLGYVVNYIQHPPGNYLTIFAGAILMLLCLLPDLIGSGKPEEGSAAAKESKRKKKHSKGGKYLRK